MKNSKNKIIVKSIAPSSYHLNEAFKTLRTNVQFCGSDIKCIAVTSCTPDEGKSIITSELARSISELNKKVLLIDADMRKSIAFLRHKTNGTYVGLSQYLSGQADMEDILYSTQYENFDIVLCGIFPPNPVELLSGTRFSEFLKNCRAKYDYVIIDTPPLGAVIDAAVIAPLCDGTILVIAEKKTSYRLAQIVKMQLEKSNAKIIGSVLNFAKIGTGTLKYYYSYRNDD